MHSLTIVQIYYSTMQNYLMVIHIAKKHIPNISDSTRAFKEIKNFGYTQSLTMIHIYCKYSQEIMPNNTLAKYALYVLYSNLLQCHPC